MDNDFWAPFFCGCVLASGIGAMAHGHFFTSAMLVGAAFAYIGRGIWFFVKEARAAKLCSSGCQMEKAGYSGCTKGCVRITR